MRWVSVTIVITVMQQCVYLCTADTHTLAGNTAINFGAAAMEGPHCVLYTAAIHMSVTENNMTHVQVFTQSARYCQTLTKSLSSRQIFVKPHYHIS
jgi:hypothetical protein